MLSLNIAFRYLRAKKSHRAVNIITLIAVIGVAIATMAMVIVMSIFNGFSDLAINQLSEMDPDLALVPVSGKTVANADSISEIALSIPGVAAARPAIIEKAVLVDGSLRVPVTVKGIVPDTENAAHMEKLMIAGEYASESGYGDPAIQLSVGVANQIEQGPSSSSLVNLYVPRRQGRINPANPSAAFRTERLAFSGVFRINNPDIDGAYVVVPLEAARQLLDYETEATQVEITVGNDSSAGSVKKALKNNLGPDYRVLTRLEQRAESLRMISVEKWVTFMMLTAILVIALFNVISTLSLLAIEKRDNMWTLRSLGAPLSMVRNVFIAEGFLVTSLGGLIGIAGGVILTLVQQFFHPVKLAADASTLTIDYYPVRLAPVDLLVIAGVIMALAFIVSAVTRLIIPRKNFS